MDHSVKVMNSHRKVAFSRLFNQKRFENGELEQLYQRYIFKLQQSSIVSALLLLALLSISISIIQFYFIQMPTLIGVYCLIQCIIFILLFISSFRMQDTQLLALCYIILLFCLLFCLLLAPINLHYLFHNVSDNGNGKNDLLKTPNDNVWPKASLSGNNDNVHMPAPKPTDGLWAIMFVIFLIYTMLPIKITISLIFGALISAAHIAITMLMINANQNMDDALWQNFIHKQVIEKNLNLKLV